MISVKKGITYGKRHPLYLIYQKTYERITTFDIIIMIIIITKIIKYKSLCIEIQRMWNLKCMIIPVITGATGKLRKKFGSCTRKTFDRLITEDGYTWNSTHNTESTAV
jgi:hypothetical protein